MRPWILLLLTAGASLGAFWDRDAPHLSPRQRKTR